MNKKYFVDSDIDMKAKNRLYEIDLKDTQEK